MKEKLREGFHRDELIIAFPDGIATIEATINTNNSENSDNIQFNTSLPVATDGGMFSKEKSIEMSKEMISWFDNKDIQSVEIHETCEKWE